MKYYQNNKSGKVYVVVSPLVFNATNAQDGQQMVLYHLKDSAAQTYVREYNEFHEKFTLLGEEV